MKIQTLIDLCRDGLTVYKQYPHIKELYEQASKALKELDAPDLLNRTLDQYERAAIAALSKVRGELERVQREVDFHQPDIKAHFEKFLTQTRELTASSREMILNRRKTRTGEDYTQAYEQARVQPNAAPEIAQIHALVEQLEQAASPDFAKSFEALQRIAIQNDPENKLQESTPASQQVRDVAKQAVKHAMTLPAYGECRNLHLIKGRESILNELRANAAEKPASAGRRPPELGASSSGLNAPAEPSDTKVPTPTYADRPASPSRPSGNSNPHAMG